MEALKIDYISTGQPTYWPTDPQKIPDLIDFAVIKGIPKLNTNAESCLDLSSDHTPILVEISNQILIEEKPCVLYNKSTNWAYFQEEVENNLNNQISLK